MIREVKERMVNGRFHGNEQAMRTRLREMALIALIPALVSAIAVGVTMWRTQAVMTNTLTYLEKNHDKDIMALRRRADSTDDDMDGLDKRVRNVEGKVTELRTRIDWYEDPKPPHGPR